jgi:hypothetical protein
VRLADHIELDEIVAQYQERATLEHLQQTANGDFEKFAFGVFLFLTNDEFDGAIALWKECGLDVAKVAIAVHSEDPGAKI